MEKLRIAMVGTKGIPAVWGGIEKYVEEISKRLVKRGHEVTVFGSRWYCGSLNRKIYQGVRIRPLPSLHLQASDALSNAFMAVMGIIGGDYQIVHFHGYASYYFIPLVRQARKKTLITTHGVESGWMNPKYGAFGRRIIRQGFQIGLRHAHIITTVAEHLREDIKRHFQADAYVAPSGLDQASYQEPDIITRKYSLKGKDYLLFLGRIDPIKRVEWVVDLREILPEEVKIVIAGGAQDSSTENYLNNLKRTANNCGRVIFTGPVFGQEKTELLSNCLVFLAPSTHEGLPITMLEAAAHGKCCLASDIPAHSAVIEDGVSGLLFPSNDKAMFMKKVVQAISRSHEVLECMGREACRKIQDAFDWDRTTGLFESLYERLLRT
jgi:glycosyltransferase involved in cell wall biosynthesis